MEITARLNNRFRYSTILLKQLVKTDFKLRYQNSFLGYLWSLLKPLFLFAIMYAVFVRVLHANYGVDHNGVYLLFGIVIWSFFAEMTGGSVGSVVGKGDLMRKLNFPRYVIVLSVAFAAVINLLLNFIIVAVFMVADRVAIYPHILLAVFVLAELFLLGVSISFFLGAAYVRLRDIGYIWDIIMQGLFYATPTFLPLGSMPLIIRKIIMLNPLAQTMQDLRYLVVTPKTTTIASVYGNRMMRLVPFGITVAMFLISAWYFKKRSKYFAEEI